MLSKEGEERAKQRRLSQRGVFFTLQTRTYRRRTIRRHTTIRQTQTREREGLGVVGLNLLRKQTKCRIQHKHLKEARCGGVFGPHLNLNLPKQPPPPQPTKNKYNKKQKERKLMKKCQTLKHLQKNGNCEVCKNRRDPQPPSHNPNDHDCLQERSQCGLVLEVFLGNQRKQQTLPTKQNKQCSQNW